MFNSIALDRSDNHYTYRVTWSSDDNEHVGLCTEFPSLSWLAPSPEKALSGIRKVVADVVEEMTASGESIPLWFTEAAEQGVSPLPHAISE